MLDTGHHKAGRPKKFGRPSRPVTVTLPEDVLARLTAVNDDLGRAIVTLVERRATTRVRPAPPAELSTYGTHAVILVNRAKALSRLAGVQLVPVGNGRALISLDRVKSIPELELEVGDALARDDVTAAGRQTLEAIAEILRHARRSRVVTLEERLIIVLEKKRSRRV